MTQVELMKWCSICECPSHKDCDLCMYELGRADERAKVIKEISDTIDRELESSNNSEYKCKDGTEIHTDVGYVYEWWNEYKKILQKGEQMNSQLQRLTETIEEVAKEVCEKLCKYHESIDDDCVCDYMRQGNNCPLEKI